MATTPDARSKALAAALDQLDKKFGKGTIMKMDAEGMKGMDSISSGSLILDDVLGIGGIPQGRIIEVYGPESAGKTTLVYHFIAQAQAQGMVCAFIDAEHAMDPLYAQAIGVNIDELLVSQPDYGEQALEIADTLARSGAVGLIAVDSVAALTPRSELEGAMGDTSVGLQARMMGQAMRKLAAVLNNSKTTMIFTNQLREKVGVVFGSPETQPGGRALKFYASQRLDIRKAAGGPLKDGDKAVGHTAKVKIVKNKVAPPFRVAEIDILYGTGISLEGEVLSKGLEFGLVQKSGAFWSYGDLRLGQGLEKARQFLKDNPELRDDLVAQLRVKMGIDEGEAIIDDPVAEGDAELEAELASVE